VTGTHRLAHDLLPPPAGVSATIAVLSRVIAPVEEAYRLGYRSGHEDGRRAGMPQLLKLREPDPLHAG
jgi:hypothetical protein